MDAAIDTIVFGANSVNRHIPANEDVYIEEVYPSTSGGNITLYIKVRGSGSISPDIQVNRLVDVNIMGEISGTSIEQFKSILNEGTIDIPYTGSDALHSISLVVSISDGDTTTTSSPIPGSDVRFTNNTNTDIQIYGVLYNGDTASPPMQPGQHYTLVHNNNDAETDSYIELRTASESDILLPFSSLKITAFNYEGQEFDVPYEHNQDAMGQHLYRVSFKELIEKRFTTVSINGNISNPTTTTTTTTSSSTPTPITEQQILVSNIFIGEDGPTFGITMDNNINFNNVVPSKLHSLSPNASGIYVTYTPSSRYLAVVSPKTNGFKDTIVATILVPVDGSFEYESHTLYPINSMDNESSKYFLFDLSKSPYVGTAAYSNPYVELHNYNSHSISSIPPFIDGNIPPFADEK